MQGSEPAQKIEVGVLHRLAIAARMDREAFFAEHPRWRRLYGDRVEAVVVAEGARRQLEGSRLAPLEIWTFFRHHPDGPFPTRRRRVSVAREPWQQVMADPALKGRPLMLVSVSLEADRFDDPLQVVRRDLIAGKTPSARRLGRAPVVVVEPASERGRVVWTPDMAEAAGAES